MFKIADIGWSVREEDVIPTGDCFFPKSFSQRYGPVHSPTNSRVLIQEKNSEEVALLGYSIIHRIALIYPATVNTPITLLRIEKGHPFPEKPPSTTKEHLGIPGKQVNLYKKI